MCIRSKSQYAREKCSGKLLLPNIAMIPFDLRVCHMKESNYSFASQQYHNPATACMYVSLSTCIPFQTPLKGVYICLWL